MKKFTKDHEWIELVGDIGTVGITDYAQSQLGDVVSIELPKLGSVFKQKDSFSVVDSMKASSEIYAPASGEVVYVNEELLAKPELINSSAMEKGWIAKFKIKDKAELDSLMDEQQYKDYIAGLSH